MNAPSQRFFGMSMLLLSAGYSHAEDPYGFPPPGGYPPGSVWERLDRLERRSSSDAMMELLNRQEQLTNELRSLRGELEELDHELNQVKTQLDSRLQAVEQRPQQPASAPSPTTPAPTSESGTDSSSSEQQPAPTPAPVAQSQPQTAEKAAATPPAGNPADQSFRRSAYQKAVDTLKAGRYADASNQFKAFITTYQSGELVDNAYYWLGDSLYVQRNLNEARSAFRKVVDGFPQSVKQADALLKLGYIEYDQNQYGKARELLNDVLKRFPDSNAARQAQVRLEKMKQEGR